MKQKHWVTRPPIYLLVLVSLSFCKSLSCSDSQAEKQTHTHTEHSNNYALRAFRETDCFPVQTGYPYLSSLSQALTQEPFQPKQFNVSILTLTLGQCPSPPPPARFQMWCNSLNCRNCFTLLIRLAIGQLVTGTLFKLLSWSCGQRAVRFTGHRF